jgi:mono/diheme cytochrome c family protein
MTVLKSVVATLVVLALAAVAFVYAGLFNVSTAHPDNPLLGWALGTTMMRSVQSRAQGIVPPANFGPATSNRGLVAEGAQLYDAACKYCHGAPGADGSDAAMGMMPEPPYYDHLGEGWSPSQLFWIVKNGVRMTAMPGWGKTRQDPQIWAIVAFVQEVGKTSAEDYQRLLAPAAPAEGTAPPAN